MTLLVHVNPDGDAVFAAVVRRCAGGVTDPEALERALRDTYPRAVVHPRLLADELRQVWYVYRDGRWSPEDGKGMLRAEPEPAT